MNIGEPQAMAVLLGIIAVIALAIYFVIPRTAQTLATEDRRDRKAPVADGLSWTERAANNLGIVMPPPGDGDATLPPQASSAAAPSEQLIRVMAAEFAPKRILSRAEYEVFRIVEREAIAAGGGHRVFAQVSLGEVLSSPDEQAFFAVNAKRADCLVVGHDGMPCFAVEYKGEGHCQSQAAARDAVKKEALRKAGVGYVEIAHTHSLEERENLIRMQLRQYMPPPQRARPALRPVLRPVLGAA